MKIKTFIWLLVLACLWGPAFLFVKVAVEDIPPLTLVAARLSLAAVLLYGILRFQGRTLPKFGLIWLHIAIVGFLYNAVPFTLLSWGQQYIDSALAAILIGTTPIFTMILAHLFTTHDHLTPAKVFGVTLGLGGLVLLLGPELSGGLQVSTWGLLAGVAAAASYGSATVYAQQKVRGLPPLVGPTIQVATAAFCLLPLALIVERPYTLPIPAWPAAGSLLMLAIFSTAVAFVIYYRAMEFISATTLSMVTYMIPIVATILGVVVLSERPGWNAYLGCALIIGGVMAANGRLSAIEWRRWTHAVVKEAPIR